MFANYLCLKYIIYNQYIIIINNLEVFHCYLDLSTILSNMKFSFECAGFKFKWQKKLKLIYDLIDRYFGHTRNSSMKVQHVNISENIINMNFL